eukprot:GHUV01048788.1.p4 GENE.GHUV01048788.1~~GHUV01048788.1.p4  ORF type:complete len:111 (-),score=38.65 GHUV01048788.1:471-803(-)
MPAGPAFDFQTYMASTAKQVNAALDKAVPAKYPETLNDAMRSVPGRGFGTLRPADVNATAAAAAVQIHESTVQCRPATAAAVSTCVPWPAVSQDLQPSSCITSVIHSCHK